MLYKSQKEVLLMVFIVISIYPSYRIYKKYRTNVKKAQENVEIISNRLIDKFIEEDTTLSGTQDTFRFNLNEVSWEAIALIPGIGKENARKIVNYRLKNGKFKSLEDILKIKGIGKKTYEKLKPYVYVE